MISPTFSAEAIFEWLYCSHACKWQLLLYVSTYTFKDAENEIQTLLLRKDAMDEEKSNIRHKISQINRSIEVRRGLHGHSRSVNIFMVQNLTMYYFGILTLRALAHYTQNRKDFTIKNRCENHCTYIKLLKTSLQLWKKVIVCMKDNCNFCGFTCSVQGPLLG